MSNLKDNKMSAKNSTTTKNTTNQSNQKHNSSAAIPDNQERRDGPGGN